MVKVLSEYDGFMLTKSAIEKHSEQRNAVAAYKRIARELLRLQVDACRHISRRDNNDLFEVAFFVKDVASRMKTGYKSTDYHGLFRRLS